MYTLPSQREFGYWLSPDHFQMVKRVLAPDWVQKMLCIIVPNRWTASPQFFSSVCTRRLLTWSWLFWLMHQRNAGSQETFSLIQTLHFQNTVYPKTKDAFPKIQAWAWKVNSHFFSLYRDYSNSLTLSNASELFWSCISINHIEVHKEKKILSLLAYVLHKTWN